MNIILKKIKLPDSPGVYFFMGGKKDKGGYKKTGREILYIGKATSLKNRVRSYFLNGLIETRGLHMVDMVAKAQKIFFEKTDSVLEALILESNLIKKYQPKYNTDEKDDKSFNCVVITKEEFPRVLIVRQKDIDAGSVQRLPFIADKIFGPFPHGTKLKEALKIVRKIFPFRDRCVPCINPRKSALNPRQSAGCKPCFNRQIGLCPGVCTGEISARDYGKIIQNIILFFSAKKPAIIKRLKMEMKNFAKTQEFEKATEVRKTIFALEHIEDIALIKNDYSKNRELGGSFRIEAYDVAHLGGGSAVGVMTVVSNGEADKNEYRKFKLKGKHNGNDISSLVEILERRLSHGEWTMPNLIVVDGGLAQKNTAEQIISEKKLEIRVISVVKNEFHKPDHLLGMPSGLKKEKEILLANSEAHRFAIGYHRKLNRNASLIRE